MAQAQVDALLGGDEQAFLALVDPAQPDVVAKYRTLRGMKVNHAQDWFPRTGHPARIRRRRACAEPQRAQ